MTNDRLFAELHAACLGDSEWAELRPWLDDPAVGIHLAVMIEPFLDYLLSGVKTIESRFSKYQIAPYERASPGDLVFLKAGPVVGVFTISSVSFIPLAGDALRSIRDQYARAICAEDEEFWVARADRRFASLLEVADVRKLPPVSISKRDKRGWITLRRPFTSANDDLLSLL